MLDIQELFKQISTLIIGLTDRDAEIVSHIKKSSIFERNETQENKDEFISNNDTNPINRKERLLEKLKQRNDSKSFMEDENALNELLELGDEQFERALQLLYVEERGFKQFSSDEIIDLAYLSDKEFELAKSVFYIENRDYQFVGKDIAYFTKLSNDEERERVIRLFHTERKNGTQFFNNEIFSLAKLSDDELSWAQQNLFDRYNLYAYQYFKIAQSYSDELMEYLDKHPDNLSCDYMPGKYAKFVDNNYQKCTFDKTGLVETSETEKLPDKEGISKITQTTVFNKKLNVKEVLTKGIPSYRGNKELYLDEKLTYYDKNGSIIKTVTLKRNPENGTLNVSETDKNGNQIPIQWQSIDPNTGANITERHLTSPEGVKTDYYAEESENLKITNYKITDKEGKDLINMHQTFERISSNKCLSSINATGYPENTQIYEMEYTDDNRVIILDKTNDKTTEIDLKRYFSDEESLKKLLPIIKECPGHVLLKFAEKPYLKLTYNNLSQNGRLHGDKMEIGNYEKTPDEKESLLATIMHEFGHYLDLEDPSHEPFNSNPDVIKIFNEEFEAFLANTTTEQHKIIQYFTNPYMLHEYDPAAERVAETHSMLYTTTSSANTYRQFYLAQYFPRTMAKIMELLLEEEGVKVK